MIPASPNHAMPPESSPVRPQGAERADSGTEGHPVDSVPANPKNQPPRPPGYDLNVGPFAHGQCGRWWTGAKVGHCGNCHQEFSSGAFDAHQTTREGVITCSTEGLVGHEKAFGTLWRMPGGGRWGNDDD